MSSGRRTRQRKKAKYFKEQKKSAKGRITCFVVLFLLISLGCYYKLVACPAIDGIAQIKATAMINQIVNSAMREEFADEAQALNLLKIETNESGKIEMVQSNTAAINALVTNLSRGIHTRLGGMAPYKMTVPVGSILGNKIASHFGPSMQISILPISVSGMDFRTEFEEQGINQTKYKVYAVITSDVRVLAPFSTNMLEVHNTVLIAEAVILGEVPESYVVVPYENILDVSGPEN